MLGKAKRRRQTKDVIKGKRRHNDFFSLFKCLRDPRAGLLDISQDVSVREHGAFGNPRCSACVLQKGNVGVVKGLLGKAVGFSALDGFTEIDVSRKIENGNNFFDATQNKIHCVTLEKAEHVARFGRDDVTHDGAFKRVFQGLSEVFDDDDGFGAAIGELM